MTPLEISRFGKGGLHIEKKTDYVYGGAAPVPPFDWTKPCPFTVPLVATNQGHSLSCTGQAAANMAKILYFLKTGILEDFSPRFIYSQVFLPGGGAYGRDALAKLADLGIPTNTDFPSEPESEQHMEDKTGIDIVLPKAKLFDIYGDNAYALIMGGIDEVAAAIRDHKCVMLLAKGDDVGWQGADIKPPVAAVPWGHAFTGIEPLMRNGRKAIDFINSWTPQWGENGHGFIDELYFKSSSVMAAYTITPNYIIPNPFPMVDQNILNLIYQAVFHRAPDAGAQGYIGQPVDVVLNALISSKEFTEYTPIVQEVKKLENDIRSGQF